MSQFIGCPLKWHFCEKKASFGRDGEAGRAGEVGKMESEGDGGSGGVGEVGEDGENPSNPKSKIQNPKFALSLTHSPLTIPDPCKTG